MLAKFRQKAPLEYYRTKRSCNSFAEFPQTGIFADFPHVIKKGAGTLSCDGGGGGGMQRPFFSLPCLKEGCAQRSGA